MRNLLAKLFRPNTESVLLLRLGSYFRDEEEFLDYIVQYYPGWVPMSWIWVESQSPTS